MMRYLRRRAKPLVGIDVQAHEIRIVQLRKLKTSIVVEQIGIAPLTEAFMFTAEKPNWEMLLHILSTQVQTLHLMGAPAALVLPTALMKFETLKLPAGLTEAEMGEEVKQHLEQEWQMSREDICVDFTYETSPNAQTTRVLIAGAKMSYVSDYVACVQAAGLSVKIIDIDSYALKRATHFNEIQNESPFNKMTLAARVDRGLIVQHANDLLTACGAAMREVPAW